jgi:hypothetical protein
VAAALRAASFGCYAYFFWISSEMLDGTGS